MHSEEAKIYIALLIAAGVLGCILIMFILSVFYQQKKHRQLHQEKINAEIKTLENERRRVARDLHDEVAVVLSVAKLKLSSIEGVQHKPLFSDACSHIDDVLVKIKEIGKDLMPVTLERKGLLSALEEFFITVNDTNTIQIHYTIPNIDLHLPKGMQIHVYRIVQEIIHNALKHSGASDIQFNLKQDPVCVKIYISDNGKGFNQVKVIKEHSGLGLHTISSRVEMLNGDIYLDAEEERGVAYTIEIPLITKP